jgi:predicted deacylase
MSEPFTLHGVAVAPGEARTIRLGIAAEYTLDAQAMPVRVVRGHEDGPRLFVSAAVHGDELVGVEIIRRLLSLRGLRALRGTLIAVPVVNVYGYEARSRYLPDRRDLNRSFPGSPTGSMAARLAHLFMREIVDRSTHGIDLHTGARHRTNLPHVRISLADPEATRLAEAFGARLVMHAGAPDGSMRQAVQGRGVPVLLYEAGEALRLSKKAVRTGLRGVVSVMRALGMLPGEPLPAEPPVWAVRSEWTRAPESGTLLLRTRVGDTVEAGETVGWLTAPVEAEARPVVAAHSGVVVGQATLPLVYEGEAILHIALPASEADRRQVLDDPSAEAYDEFSGPLGPPMIF